MERIELRQQLFPLPVESAEFHHVPAAVTDRSENKRGIPCCVLEHEADRVIMRKFVAKIEDRRDENIRKAFVFQETARGAVGSLEIIGDCPGRFMCEGAFTKEAIRSDPLPTGGELRLAALFLAFQPLSE